MKEGAAARDMREKESRGRVEERVQRGVLN